VNIDIYHEGEKIGRVQSFNQDSLDRAVDFMRKGFTTIGARSAEGKSLMMEEISEINLMRERRNIEWFKTNYVPTYVRYTKGLKNN
jgi:hypothetical protein